MSVFFQIFEVRYVVLVFTMMWACSSQIKKDQSELHPDFISTWSKGKAEVSSFDLKQARYGEMHKGKLVLIFVKERVHQETFIKLDHPDQEGNDILKCNIIRKFTTGLYDYSIMTTVMTGIDPAEQGNLLKLSNSTQDWCGHVYSELIRDGNSYDYQLNSYFEGESNVRRVAFNLSEDGLLNQIRINPEQISDGNVSIVPSLTFLRLRHMECAPQQARIEKEEINGQVRLVLTYETIDRQLEVTYNKAFPYEITGIAEHYMSGWGESEKELRTESLLNQREWLEYWKLHQNSDELWREKMNLD